MSQRGLLPIQSTEPFCAGEDGGPTTSASSKDHSLHREAGISWSNPDSETDEVPASVAQYLADINKAVNRRNISRLAMGTFVIPKELPEMVRAGMASIQSSISESRAASFICVPLLV